MVAFPFLLLVLNLLPNPKTLNLVAATAARNYVLQDNFVGQGFTSGFYWQNIPDPTHGRVNYVDYPTAYNTGLVSWDASTFTMRADNVTTLNSTGPGRNAQRIVSHNRYTTSVIVLDLAHMPQGCGTWPAFWMTSDDPNAPWPTAGELDILEGVNDQGPNASTLHTTNNCTMASGSMIQTGTLPASATNCYVGVNSNTGCQVQNNKPNSYGPALNSIGGGWYVAERTSSFINVWFWARNDPAVPDVLKNGGGSINAAHLGTPYANFVNGNCDIGSKFGPNNIIINLTFCGDWAGNAYPASCPQTCVNNVNKNPGAFTNAYWTINAVRVYEPGCATTTTPDKRSLDAHRKQHRYDREL